ncbi:hypothetical protein QOZ80_2AG0125350 [Eleusine coracana subsp. coracana]|nr:hypothetical protein QOZ80_2AG0125350 [Eleusine coracana subsp. coracana]
MMRDAEETVLGRTPPGRAAAAMQSRRRGENENEEAAHDAEERGVAVSEARVPGGRVVTEFVADQPVKVYLEADEETTRGAGIRVVDGTKITIGEALEATAFSAGDQAVEPSDAEAIAAAEASAAGTGSRSEREATVTRRASTEDHLY